MKKTFLQLRCSNVLLHLKYKLPLCKPEIEFKNQTGARALATDHRETFRSFHEKEIGELVDKNIVRTARRLLDRRVNPS